MSTTACPAGEISLRAPAKLNLGLRVLGRRADGYHLLESVFVPLDFGDELAVRIEPAREPSVAIRVRAAEDAPPGLAAEVPADERNLACRAARAFLERAGLLAAVEIELVKRIPAGAGLGGGSSDAGAVLRALGRLAPGALDGEATRALALTLGADVSYFLDPRPALVAGIGERIEPIGPLPKLAFALAHPGISLSTAQVYAAWDALAPALTATPAGSTLRALSDLGSGDPSDRSRFAERLGTLITNDLEAAAVRLCPPIRRLAREIAAAGALATGMSGSGATVYGVFASEQEAAAAVRRVGAGTSAARCWVRLAAIGAAG